MNDPIQEAIVRAANASAFSIDSIIEAALPRWGQVVFRSNINRPIKYFLLKIATRISKIEIVYQQGGAIRIYKKGTQIGFVSQMLKVS